MGRRRRRRWWSHAALLSLSCSLPVHTSGWVQKQDANPETANATSSPRPNKLTTKWSPSSSSGADFCTRIAPEKKILHVLQGTQRERREGRGEEWALGEGTRLRQAMRALWNPSFLCPFESCREFSNNPCLQQFVQRSLKPFGNGCWRILREECSRRRGKRICRCKVIFLAVSERELERKQERCPWEEEEQVH